jgi:hypothetical protein
MQTKICNFLPSFKQTVLSVHMGKEKSITTYPISLNFGPTIENFFLDPLLLPLIGWIEQKPNSRDCLFRGRYKKDIGRHSSLSSCRQTIFSYRRLQNKSYILKCFNTTVRLVLICLFLSIFCPSLTEVVDIWP